MQKKLIALVLLSFGAGLLVDHFALPKSVPPVVEREVEPTASPTLTPAAAVIAQPDPAKPADPAAQQGNELAISKLTLTPKVDLSEVTVTYHITPTNRSADAWMQLYVHRDDITARSQWDAINTKDEAGKPLILNLYQGQDNTGTFKVNLPKGVYGACRVLLFNSPDGKSVDSSKVLYDSNQKLKVALNATVSSEDRRVLAPMLAPATAETEPGGDGTSNVTLKLGVKVPEDYHAQEGGFWVMAKSGKAFGQVWAGMKNAQEVADGDNRYKLIPVQVTLKGLANGLYNAQIGLFKYSFGDPLEWTYPGTDFEVGDDWVVKAPEDKMPPRLRVKNGRFVTLDGKPYDFYPDAPAARKAVSFVRGGNYGNAITWTLMPALNKPGYFVLLKTLGCRYIRFNFNSDRYNEPIYQHAVDQVVQNIWAAGLYPVLAPQDLPQAGSREGRVEKGYQVVRTMAAKYVGKPIWLELCNEPHDFQTWEEWRPVAIRYMQAIRKIDPDAFIVVPLEGYGKDGRGAAKHPITEEHVDLYDGHAYVKPEDVATLYAPITKAGLPLLIGEYGGDKADYLEQMNRALQNLTPAPLAAGPWAFTVKGQDSLPLVENGTTAVLHLTSTGQTVADAYSQWDAGKKLK